MKYNIRGNKIEVTGAIKEYIESKLSRLDKYLDDSKKVEAKAIISAKGTEQKVEVTIWNGKYNIRAEEKNEDLYASIDLVIDKLERQFRRYKDKINDKKKKKNTVEEVYTDYVEPISENVVAKRKEVFLKPIDEEEAITQMELLEHSFFIFKSEITGKINVIYKRKDGDYGIIEAN